MQNYLVYVINLDKDIDRLARARALLERQRVEFERLPAILGSSVPNWLRARFCQANRLLPGQIGCYASHLVAAKKLLESKSFQAVIFEDDIVPLENLTRLLTQTLEHAPKGWDLINLAASSRRAMLSVAKVASDHHIVRYSRYPWSTAGYLLSRTGAEKLLISRPRTVLYDVELRHPWCLNLNCYGVEPSLVRQTGDFPSSISQIPPAARRLGGGTAWYIRTLGLGGLCRCGLANFRISIDRWTGTRKRDAPGDILT